MTLCHLQDATLRWYILNTLAQWKRSWTCQHRPLSQVAGLHFPSNLDHQTSPHHLAQVLVVRELLMWLTDG